MLKPDFKQDIKPHFQTRLQPRLQASVEFSLQASTEVRLEATFHARLHARFQANFQAMHIIPFIVTSSTWAYIQSCIMIVSIQWNELIIRANLQANRDNNYNNNLCNAQANPPESRSVYGQSGSHVIYPLGQVVSYLVSPQVNCNRCSRKCISTCISKCNCSTEEYMYNRWHTAR